ncbi:MAG: phosphatase PAP2 family protein [Elusimicrobia bacterium]|nr:phosphatase PAP2 family protein [Elusimicrobiota bacterium]
MNMKERLASGLLVLLAVLTAAGCSTMADGRRRADGATLRPGWARTGRAAKAALLRPEVWVPAAGALVIGAAGADKRISSWASSKTPVYGSTDKARKASNTLISVSNAAYWASVAAAPSGPYGNAWLYDKAKTAAAGVAANTAAFQATLSLQRMVGRQRPNGAGRSSFPSLHTAYAASQTMSAWTNFESLRLGGTERALIRGGLDAVPLATAWARVEAKAHYPSDTLAAMALSSFLSSFVAETFLGGAPLRTEVLGRTPVLVYRARF